MVEEVIIGATVHKNVISSIGDTLCLTPIIEAVFKQQYRPLIVATEYPELFFNNPYVKASIYTKGEIKKINPDDTIIDISHSLPYVSIEYSSNVVEFYSERTGIKLLKDHKPRLYLSEDEMEYGRNQLREFEGFKRIAVSMTTSASCKDLKYEYMLPLLDRLRNDGYKLIGFGKENFESRYNWDKSFINKTTVREACSIMKFCHLYMGVDAGLYHIAAALNIPQVVFFRSNQSSNNSYSDTFNMESKIRCEGDCLARHLHDCQSDNRCMDNFNLDRYYNLITRILPT